MKTLALLGPVLLAGVVCALPQGSGGSYGGGKQPDGYFQYVNVPAPHEYEFGWNRGNPHHYISRYEQAKDWRFRTRVRWGDEKGGYGEHYWEYNHAPKDGYHQESYKAPEPAYAPPAPAYSPPAPAYAAPPAYH